MTYGDLSFTRVVDVEGRDDVQLGYAVRVMCAVGE